MSAKRLIILAALCLAAAGAGPSTAAPAYDGTAWRRDPFRYREPAPTQAEEEYAGVETVGSVALKGIVLADDGSFRALISGREYRAGDVCNGIRILRVNQFGIVVESGGETREIELFHAQ